MTGPNDEQANPMHAAQRLMRPELPRRFYAKAEAGARTGGHAVLLDGRPLRTPGKAELVLPSAALADAVASEWATVTERIDPAMMPLTRLANSAIDGVTGREAEVAADLVRYAGSDLVCYRADYPVELARREAAAWDPVIAWAAEAIGARFVCASGVMHVAQPQSAVAAVTRTVEGLGPFRLAALHSMTTLTGSVLIALAHARGALDAEAAWSAAHVEEDWQISQWGEDAEAAARRQRRKAEHLAASLMLRLTAGA